jgi:hypothetical protein
LTYLSFHPEGLKEVFLTGGLAPLVEGPDTVYEAVVGAFVAPNPDLRSEADRTPVRVAKRNEVYYRKYPADIQRVSQDPCQAEHEQTFK